MVDDSYYITPHETALAVVATSMKKARLRLDTLVINSVMGGILFSAGGMLYLAARAENPLLFQENPGLLNYLGAFTFSIGLFYVVINGADLFNSNVLFFSVGVLRGAVSIYDLLISWSISWLGNLAGTLFVCYVICHLSGVTATEQFINGSRSIVEGKAAPSFIQTFIRGIAGNFYVCLAVYLQLMCKPIHVKYLVMTLPIFTFVAMGFTHVVADMYLLMMGMINGADLSVGTYIWKILISATLGNIVGGSFFGAMIPFYLHLMVVERDRKMLSLPEFEARDEQPELNMDSRVVRVTPSEVQAVEGEDTESDFEEKDDDYYDDRDGLLSEKQSNGSGGMGNQDNGVEAYAPSTYAQSVSPARGLQRVHTTNTLASTRTRGSGAGSAATVRSPPGVFPVRGMGKPLTRERTIVDSEYSHESHPRSKRDRSPSITNTFDMISTHSDMDSNLDNPLATVSPSTSAAAMREPSSGVGSHNPLLHTLSKISTRGHPLLGLHSRMSMDEELADADDQEHEDKQAQEEEEEKEYTNQGYYNVREHKLGTKLERALTRIATRRSTGSSDETLPRTTQDVFPEQMAQPEVNPAANTGNSKRNSMAGLFRTLSKQFVPSKQVNDVDEIHRRLSMAGITSKAARASDNIAGIENYDGIKLPPSHSPFYRRPSSASINTLPSLSRPLRGDGTASSDTSSGPKLAASTTGGGSLSVAGKRQPPNLMKNMVHFDNDNFEEQSVRDL